MDPDRPIEKLLRRYAKKRRDEAGVPLELHPATRRLLQGEVARQLPKADGKEKHSFADWLAALRRRWVYATAASAVLIAGVLLLVLHQPTPPALDLAKNETTSVKLPVRKPAPGDSGSDRAGQSAFAPPTAAREFIAEAPAPALAPMTQPHEANEPNLAFNGALASDAGTRHSLALNSEPAAVPPAAAPAGPPPVAFAGKSLEQKAAASGAKFEEFAGAARADKLASTQPVVTGESRPALPAVAVAPVAAESRRFAPIARGGGLEREKVPEYSQSFANVAPLLQTEKTRSAAPASPVLSSFQVEQTGDRVAVIDSDGSTYLGELNSVPVNLSAGKDVQKFKSDGQPAGRFNTGRLAVTRQSTQDYFFRVAGTNRTLNQQVVFTWNFVELTNAPAQSKTKGVGGLLNPAGSSIPQQFPALLQNSAINGRAQINAAKEFEINAVPVTP